MGTTEHPLRSTTRPAFEEGARSLRIVDLFSGCGGLTLGVAQASRGRDVALEVALAVDNDEAALSVYRENFPKANTSELSIDSLFDGKIGKPHSAKETALLKSVGPVHAIIGGPPCQGHSDLNNHTRRMDPRNELYLRMVRAVEVFRPPVLLIENVPSVVHSTPDVVGLTKLTLDGLGYSVCDRVLQLHPLGVPQMRKRHVLLATHSPDLTAEAFLQEVPERNTQARDLRWAIGDLATIKDGVGFDQPPRASKDNLHRMRIMIQYKWWNLPANHRPPCHQDGDHSYVSMYGRLHWDKPAQTITSGFTSIGQGRYMHPEQPRALTHHEAVRIQGFPDYFDFSAVKSRVRLATMIANAVPPHLAQAIFSGIIPWLVPAGP